MSPVENKQKGKAVRYVIYDFENMLSEGGKHIPNLCVVHMVCAKCFSTPMSILEDFSCSCGRRRGVFKGEATVETFGDCLFSKKLKTQYVSLTTLKGIICISL